MSRLLTMTAPLVTRGVDLTGFASSSSARRCLMLSLTMVLSACAGTVGGGDVNPDVPSPSTTTVAALSVGETATTFSAIRQKGKLTVETSMGAWQWTRGSGHSGLQPPEAPIWVELPEPPLPELEAMVWPQFDPDFWGHRWGPGSFGGFPVTSDGGTITLGAVVGHIDWNSFYGSDDGLVESRWQPLDEGCWQVEVCPATLEVIAIRGEQPGLIGAATGSEAPGGLIDFREEGVLDVLVPTIVPGDPDAVEFRDEDSGDLVVRLEATEQVSAEQLMSAGGVCDHHGGMCGDGMYMHMLYVEGVGWVDPPWRGMDLHGLCCLQAGVRNDGFWIVGYERWRESTTLHVWGSSDGVTWEELAPPLDLGDALPNGFTPQLIDGELVILTPHQNPDEPPVSPMVLRLVNGELAEVDIDLSALGMAQGGELNDFAHTAWGWMATTWDGLCDVWVSADGTTWEKVMTPDGMDIGETVDVFTAEVSEDGSYLNTVEIPVPTPAEDVPAVVGASYCSSADDGSVFLEFDHPIDGVGTVWEGVNYPDFFSTSWLGGFVGPGR